MIWYQEVFLIVLACAIPFIVVAIDEVYPRTDFAKRRKIYKWKNYRNFAK